LLVQGAIAAILDSVAQDSTYLPDWENLDSYEKFEFSNAENR
jgi:hypothetical protein